MMKLSDALGYFEGNKSKLAAALGITKQAVGKWSLDEPIPELREKQLRYEIIPELGLIDDEAA